MTHDADAADVAQVAYVFINPVSIGNFIGDRHLLKLTLALSVSVEVEANAGDAVAAKRISDEVEHQSFLAASESVAENDHRTLLARLQVGALDESRKTAMMSVNVHILPNRTQLKCIGNPFVERLFQFVAEDGRKNNFAVGIEQHHRRNPLDTVVGSHLRFAHRLEIAQLSVADTILVDGT